MIYNLGLINVGFSIEQAIRTFFGSVAAFLYNFIVDLYNIFHTLSTVNVIDNEYIQRIYNRVGLVLGLFMLFKITFALIQYLLEPNKISDKEKGAGAIVKRFVISIVLLGITPSLFSFAFDLQKDIVGSVTDSSNVLYRFISDEKVYLDANSFGQKLSSTLFFSFYRNAYSDSSWLQVKYDEDKGAFNYELVNGFDELKQNIEGCNWTTTRKDALGNDCSFHSTVDYLTLKTLGRYIIDWDGIFSIVVAVIVIWILAMYCIQVATRAIQLAYLQLIAPVPILSYISDSEGTFKKWVNQCVSTYLDIFIRFLVIYFVLTICTQITELLDNVANNDLGLDPDSPYFSWIKIFMILGLLVFGKKVPELLKDLFPNLGGSAGKFDFGLKAPDAIKKPVKGLTTFGTGVAVGGIAGMASGIRHGEGWHKFIAAPGGLLRGAASARTKGNIIGNAKKGLSNVRAANAKAYERHHDGSSFFGRMAPVAAQRKFDSFERELQSYNDYASVVDFVDKELEKNSIVQNAMAERERMLKAGTIPTQVNVMAGDKPVIDKKTGKPLLKTIERKITDADIEKADARIKEAKKIALAREIASGDDIGLMSALANAEAIRRKGTENGYIGYNNSQSFTDSSRSFDERAESFFDVKKSAKSGVNDIQGADGSRHDEYKRSKANAQYKPK